MDNTVHSKNKKAAYHSLTATSGISVFLAVTSFFLFNKNTAYSVFLGGFAFILPNYYFARLAFRVSGKESLDLAMKFFMIGESTKLILTGIIMAICISYIKVLVITAFFGMFVIALMINLFFLHRSMPS